MHNRSGVVLSNHVKSTKAPFTSQVLYGPDRDFLPTAVMQANHPFQNDEGHAGQSIHNLVYCSRGAADMDDAEIAKIIATAQRHNPKFGITGLLVFGSGYFFQWLEGPRDNVQSLMKIISADPRHDSVVVLSQEDEIRERLFPDWAMELVEAEDIRVVLEDAVEDARDPKQKKALALMLKELNAG